MHQEIRQIDSECKEYRLVFDGFSPDGKLQTVIEGLQMQEHRLLELQIGEDEKEKAALRVLQFISDVSVEQDHHDIRNTPSSNYLGSGQWLLKSRKYLEWCNGPPSVLWLRGTVGVGKPPSHRSLSSSAWLMTSTKLSPSSIFRSNMEKLLMSSVLS
ncbi:hypothetical protein N7G274_004508 [Stereocaulon virgatum]|uniref:Nephrocystin 3-like N-terminal domain-containing protein n=1 Tax=Stereocaulon virgatum TaxID=373712 RepID=A0ABR4AA42_9LECA